MDTTRLHAAINCLLVSVDRRLCRRWPLYSNLEVQERLEELGFTISHSIARVGRGETLRVFYQHPELNFRVCYVEEESADRRSWRLERAEEAA